MCVCVSLVDQVDLTLNRSLSLYAALWWTGELSMSTVKISKKIIIKMYTSCERISVCIRTTLMTDLHKYLT